MLRHQQQLLGQVGDGRMVPPGPQLDPEVADSLDAGLALDRSEQLECLDAELAGPSRPPGPTARAGWRVPSVYRRLGGCRRAKQRTWSMTRPLWWRWGDSNSPVSRFASAGRTLRRWPIPAAEQRGQYREMA
jgi:hypothetical protein